MRYDMKKWQRAVDRANATITPSYDEMTKQMHKLPGYEGEKVYRAWSNRHYDMAEWFYHNEHKLPAF